MRKGVQPSILCIINVRAGKRPAIRRVTDYLALRARSAGYGIRFERTRFPGHATILARRYSAPDTLVCAVGGDGTVREIVEGMKKNAVLGIVPLGTVNVLAMDLGIPLDPILAVDGLFNGTVRKIDIAYLRDKPFLLMASAGIDALTVHGLDARLKGVFGRFAYALSAFRTALARKPSSFRIEIRNRGDFVCLRERGYLVIVQNGRYYAGRFVLDPRARLDSGKLHVLVYKKPGIIDTLSLVFRVLSGMDIALEDVKIYAADEVNIDAGRKPPKMQFDGDKAPPGSVRIRIEPSALAVLVPR